MNTVVDFLSEACAGDCGARFHKIDLHFHTLASHDYKEKGVSYESLVQKAIENDLAMIAVTDHN